MILLGRSDIVAFIFNFIIELQRYSTFISFWSVLSLVPSALYFLFRIGEFKGIIHFVAGRVASVSALSVRSWFLAPAKPIAFLVARCLFNWQPESLKVHRK